MCVSRFLQQNGLVHRLATHTAQRSPDDVALDAKSYMDLVVPKLVGRTRDPMFTMNMDQTNVYYRQTAKATINRRGARTVNMRAGADDSKRCTVAFTVTASGSFLPPFVVYQGTRGGYNSQARTTPASSRKRLHRAEKGMVRRDGDARVGRASS